MFVHCCGSAMPIGSICLLESKQILPLSFARQTVVGLIIRGCNGRHNDVMDVTKA